MVRLYFAHPVTHYNTAYERTCLDLVKDFFPSAEIVNPTGEDHSTQYAIHGMQYFVRLVDTCDALVFASFRDSEVGMGVYTEILAMAEKDGPIYEVNEHGVFTVSLAEFYEIRPLSVQETRDRVAANKL